MRLSLHRFPRETKVAAVVLAAALLQVGVLAALGLKSTSERRREMEKELAEKSQTVVRKVVMQAAYRVGDEETRLQRELAHDDGRSAFDRVRAAMETRVAPLFEYAYVVDADGRVADCARPPIAAPAGPPDMEARRRLADVLAHERTDPARAADEARALADDLAKKPVHDAVAAALALQSGWRAAYARREFDRAIGLATRVLERYAAVRDDRGLLGDAAPLGPAASALVCDVLATAIKTSSTQGQAFVGAVVARRVQAQRLRPALSETAYRVEVEECELRRKDATTLAPALKNELRNRLEECDALDQRQERAAAVGRRRLRDAAERAETTRFELEDGGLLTVVPLPRRAGEPSAAAFVAPPSALLAEAVQPAARDPALPDGVALVVRDAAGHDVLGRVEGRPLEGAKDEAFGSSVPNLRASVLLVDPAVLERDAAAARGLWIAVLLGAGLAVVAASLLAVRAVMREVRLARMKSDFVSNLSHELRTPLTSLRMFVEMLREGRVRDEAEAKECLDVVAQETDRLQSLVERVLQFVSFTKGRAPIELKSADVGDVARRAAVLFQKRAEAARASFELVVADPLPESIVDRDAVLQVFLNLLDNAVKYGGDNGAKIRMSVRPSSGGGGVTIDVEDDGPGVPEKERELVFEEFYRGDDTLSRRVEGTGIGLAVARRIVLVHGGRIECGRSEELGGARFRVKLPAAETGRRLALVAARGNA
jgi:two-component system phosphate regulon sensor histidine kinase PhoR